jgi:hypothetical protein
VQSGLIGNHIESLTGIFHAYESSWSGLQGALRCIFDSGVVKGTIKSLNIAAWAGKFNRWLRAC